MKYFIMLIFISFFAGVVSPRAEDVWETKKTKTGIIKYKKRTEYEFSGQELEGKIKTPSGALITPRRKMKIDKLIKLRSDFDPEVDSSAAGTR